MLTQEEKEGFVNKLCENVNGYYALKASLTTNKVLFLVFGIITLFLPFFWSSSLGLVYLLVALGGLYYFYVQQNKPNVVKLNEFMKKHSGGKVDYRGFKALLKQDPSISTRLKAARAEKAALAAQAAAEADKVYDVILESASDNKFDMHACMHDAVGFSTDEAESILNNLPAKILADATKSKAEETAELLNAFGAKATVYESSNSAKIAEEKKAKADEVKAIEKKSYALDYIKYGSYLALILLFLAPMFSLITKVSVWDCIFANSKKGGKSGAAAGLMSLYTGMEDYKNIFSFFSMFKDSPVEASLHILSIVTLLIMLIVTVFVVALMVVNYVSTFFIKDLEEPARAPFYSRYEEKLANLTAEEIARKNAKTKVLFAKYLGWKCVRLFLVCYFPFSLAKYVGPLVDNASLWNISCMAFLVVNLGVGILQWWYRAMNPVELKNITYLEQVVKI